MRKLLIASIFVSLCAADMSAFAAGPVARNKRTGGTSQPTTTTTLGASGARAAKKPAAARAAAPVAGKTTQTSIKTTTNTKTTATNGARAATTKKTMAARAGATQKVINMGTKVAKATENTTVSKECQDAFNGCMDTFCMLDNTSGGRCQCSDRNKELDLVLEEIMKLDEQSLAMATEGVERLQMGESADEIMARAKAAADNVIGVKSSSGTGVSNQTKARKLDLNAWKNNSLFAEDDDDDVFAADNLLQPGSDDFSSKTGDALQTAAIGLCVKQIPAECSASSSFLQLAYAQKIRSDCTAYENSLKQQRSASAEKLQTAQKALRDAALEAYQNENKYDFGQCVTQFKLCMQTTGECGDDYSGCVADTAILDTLYNQKNSKKGVATTAIKTGSTTVTISSATYDILNTKKVMCEFVTKQCINANKKGEVWQQVLKDLAPVVYTAEYNAASNNRMNCISTVVNCVQKSCGSQWGDGTDNFDACLSDPNSIDNYCKLEYQRCGDGDATSGRDTTMGSVRSYVMAKLAALKVDKCTQDVKECLLSEDRCGEDYSGCIGLDSDSIVDLCPTAKLLSCQNRERTDGAEAVREYIAQIAQGLALNIDNKFATACQNAVDAAFSRVCGTDAASADEDDVAAMCPMLDLKFSTIEKTLAKAYYDETEHKIYNLVDEYAKSKGLSIKDENNHLRNIFNLKALIRGKLGVDYIEFDENGEADEAKKIGTYFYVKKADYENAYKGNPNSSDYDGYDGDIAALVKEMSAKYNGIIGQLEADRTVENCMKGRTLSGISSKSTRGTKEAKRANVDENVVEQIGAETGRFTNLTKATRMAIANIIVHEVRTRYREKVLGFETTPADMYQEMLNYFTDRIEAADADFDEINKKICDAKAWPRDDFNACGKKEKDEQKTTYQKESNKCVITYISYKCTKYNKCCWGCSNTGCRVWDTGHPSESVLQLSYIDKDTGKICESDGEHDAVCN